MENMRILISSIIVFGLQSMAHGQWDGNSTPTYPEVINQCQTWANSHDEIELFQMGMSDYGLPIYLFVINGANDSIQTIKKARKSTTILVNNAIHPGEPDGVNAMLIWTKNWIEKGKKTKNMPVIAFIPAYNIGGMMTRSGTSRANQNGPEEYGFRGNAQNLDLNRDFIKMDSKNAFTFTKIFHALNPDVFIDNHVTNGADYQHVCTLISPLKERLTPSMEDQTNCKMIPKLKKGLTERKIDLVPYIDLKNQIPDNGIVAFNDLPRYAMGYASLFNTFSFTVETHMLKPFPERVQATLAFFEEMVMYCSTESKAIEKAREDALDFQKSQKYHYFNFKLDESKADSITFKGFAAKYEKSEVTGLDRLYYDRNEPWTKKIPFYQTHIATDSVALPNQYLVSGQAHDVIDRLKANKIGMVEITIDGTIDAYKQKVKSFKSPNSPYENHFLHSEVEIELVKEKVKVKAGDYLIPAVQTNMFFLQSVLFAQTEDSYFAWNFFDSYMDEKEYFSPYVFEDIAADLLRENPDLKKELDEKRKNDVDFAKSQWAQLYFIYQRSPYFEPNFRVLPVYFVY
jgi:hypothetical protein